MSNESKSSQMLVFEERGNRSYPEKTSRCRVENQRTQPTYDDESGNRTRFHIGGRRVLSPLRHPCTFFPCNVFNTCFAQYGKEMYYNAYHRSSTTIFHLLTTNVPFITEISYKERLISLDLLPVCYWHELLDVVFFFLQGYA